MQAENYYALYMVLCVIGVGIFMLVLGILAACMLSSMITWEDKDDDNNSV